MGDDGKEDDADDDLLQREDADLGPVDLATQQANAAILRKVKKEVWEHVWKLAFNMAKAMTGNDKDRATELCHETFLALHGRQAWNPDGPVVLELHVLRVLRGVGGHANRAKEREQARMERVHGEQSSLRVVGADSPDEEVARKRAAEVARRTVEGLVTEMKKQFRPAALDVIEQYAMGNDKPAEAAEALKVDVDDVNRELRRMRRFLPGIEKSVKLEVMKVPAKKKERA